MVGWMIKEEGKRGKVTGLITLGNLFYIFNLSNPNRKQQRISFVQRKIRELQIHIVKYVRQILDLPIPLEP